MKKLVLAVAFSLFSTPTFAGPDETTNALMNNSPSLLDFGVFKLESYLNHDTEKNGHYSSVTYDWDTDNIIISQWDFSTNILRKNSEASCNDYVDFVRGQALILDGEAAGGRASRFGVFFRHEGYIRKMAGKEQADILKELDKKFRIEYESLHIVNDSGTKIGSLKCTAKLLGTTVAFEFKPW